MVEGIYHVVKCAEVSFKILLGFGVPPPVFLCVGAAECGSAPGEPGTNFGFLRPCGLTARLEVEVGVSASCKLNPCFEFE